MGNELYSLYGIVNLSGIEPSFVTAIYYKDGDFYISSNNLDQEKKSAVISSFYKIDMDEIGNDIISKCKPLSNLNIIYLGGLNTESKIGDYSTYFYQLPKEIIISGNSEKMSKFLGRYLKCLQSEIAKDELIKFLNPTPQNEFGGKTK